MRHARAKTLQRHTPYLFLLPFFSLFVLFSLFPILYSLVISFTNWNGIKPMEFVAFENYARLTRDGIFLTSIRNTVLIMIITMPMPLLTGLLLALTIKDFVKRGRSAIQLANFLPYITTPVAIGFLFQILFEWQNGTVNQILLNLGLITDPINWLGQAGHARVVMVILSWWRYYGYFMVIFLAGLSSIPESMYEAAKLDGARWLQLLRYITLPMLKPVTMFLLTTSIIGGLQIFDEPKVLFSGANLPIGGPNNSVLLMIMYFYDTAFKRFDLGYGSAIAYALILLIVLFSLAFQRLTSKEE